MPKHLPGMVLCACNPSTQKADVGESWVQDQPGLEWDPGSKKRKSLSLPQW
jgi:hypothetical protein